MPVHEARVPQQSNCADCGVFVLAFARRICHLHGRCVAGHPPSALASEAARYGAPHAAMVAATEAALEDVSVGGLRQEVLQLVRERA